jgi:type III pantothenate kinase
MGTWNGLSGEMSRWSDEFSNPGPRARAIGHWRLAMILLFDIGNTHTHLGLANSERVIKQANFPTADWLRGAARARARKFAGRAPLAGAALCSVVPRATRLARQAVKRLWNVPCLELTPRTLCGAGIDYPKPETIGPDRLANAVAARHHFGAPVVVVDFGTAVTFDVVDRAGNYVGGIIAPGLAVMTEYLHEKTALLPRIRIREINCALGKSTKQAMLVGAVHGYRGLVRQLIAELKRELGTRRLPVVATGGYGQLIASRLPEITAVDPLLTLEGLRLVWQRRATCVRRKARR